LFKKEFKFFSHDIEFLIYVKKSVDVVVLQKAEWNFPIWTFFNFGGAFEIF